MFYRVPFSNAQVRAKYKELYKLHKCHPLRATVPVLCQLPIWITLSLALRKMSGFAVPWMEKTYVAPPALFVM